MPVPQCVTYERGLTHQGESQHEVWLVYSAEIVKDWVFERDSFTVVELHLGTELDVFWRPIPSLRPDPDRLCGGESCNDRAVPGHSAQ